MLTMHLIKRLMLLLAVMAVFTVLVSGPAAAADDSSGSTLPELIREALRNNPGLLAARGEAEAASNRPGSVSGYPDPRLSYSHFVESIETRLGPQSDLLQLVQPVPFPGKLSLKGEIASQETGILEDRAEKSELFVIRKIKEEYYTISGADEVLILLEREKEVLENIREVTQTRLEAGREYQHNLLKVEVELLKISEKRVEYSERKSSAVSEVMGLLNRPPENGLKIKTGFGKLPDEAVLESIISTSVNHPSLRFREGMVEKERMKLNLTRKKYLPDFSLGAGYRWIGESPMEIEDSGRDAWNISVGLTLPVWFGSIKSEVAERRGMVRVMELKYMAERTEQIRRIEVLRNKYRAAREIVQLYREELIPRAGQALESAREGYMSGKLGFIDILDSERLLINLRIKLAEKKAAAFRYLAVLEEVSGSALIPED